MAALRHDQVMNCSIREIDIIGDVVGVAFDAPGPVWASSNPAAGTLVVSPDRTSALFTPSVAGGATDISVSASIAGEIYSDSGNIAVVAQANPANTITITNRSAATLVNHPVAIGRSFMPGEIKGEPTLVGLPSQADVKQRPNGSVEHSGIAFVIPSLAVRASITFDVADSPTQVRAPLTQAQMLDPAFDFDCVIGLTHNGVTEQVSARQMLMDGNYTIWRSGSICTEITLADHSAARKYDMISDVAQRVLRPIFRAQFWPTLNKVEVRWVIENANTEQLQDLLCDVVVTGGFKAPMQVFSQLAVPFYVETRQSRTFWLGGAPTNQVDIDHNRPYVNATMALPNSDPSIQVPAATMTTLWSRWQGQTKALGDGGSWSKSMSATGQRDDLGEETGFSARWLCSFDWRMFEIVKGMADLAGSWPLHVREGKTGRFFDRAKTVDAIGHVVSLNARPQLWLDPRAKPSPDVVKIQGPALPRSPWIADDAHQPDPFSPLYLLTGDFFYLEQMWFWAAVQAASNDPSFKPPGAGGALIGTERGNAWAFRNRFNADVATPDGVPEKSYFGPLITDAIYFWEGMFRINGRPSQDTVQWKFAQSKYPPPSPLALLFTTPAVAGEELDITITSTRSSQWQGHYFIFELGRAKELGYDTGALLSFTGKMMTGQVGDPNYDWRNMRHYRTGVNDMTGAYFKTWPETAKAYNVPIPTHVLDGAGYTASAYGASTMLTGEPNGKETYALLRDNWYLPAEAAFAVSPIWAVLPR